MVKSQTTLYGRNGYYSRFDLRAFFARWCFTAFLVFSVYNPSGRSLYHWMRGGFADYWMLQLPVALLLTIFWFLTLRATLLSLRLGGIALVTAVLGSLVWVLADFGLMDCRHSLHAELAVLLLLSGVMTIGVSSMHVLTRLTGQTHVDSISPRP